MHAASDASSTAGARGPAFARKGEPVFELHFPATRDTVEGVLAMAQEWAMASGVGRADTGTLRLVLEELLLNVCFYAYSGSGPESADGPGGEVDLLLRLGPEDGGVRPQPGEEQLLFLRIRDAGRPFDPLAYTPAPVGLRPGTTQTGGRGLSFVRLLAVEAAYARTDGLNVLSLTLPLSGGQSADAADETPPPDPAAPGSAGRGLFRGPGKPGKLGALGALLHCWRTNLAVKQTVFLGLCTALTLWAALFFFHQTVNSEREKAIQSLGDQIMRTLDGAFSDMFRRLAAGTEALAASLGGLETDGAADAPGNAPDGPPLGTKTQQELARALLAEQTVLGLVYTDDSRFQEWLLTLKDGVLEQAPLSSTFPPAWSVDRRPGAAPVWQGPLTRIPGGRSGPDTALFLGLPWKKPGGPARNGLPGNPGDATGVVGVLVGMGDTAGLLRAVSGIPDSEPFLLNRDGEYLLSPPNRARAGGRATVFADARAYGSAFLAELGTAMLKEKESGMLLPDSMEQHAVPWFPQREPAAVLYRPVGEGPTAFSLGLLLPVKALGDVPEPLPPGAILFAVLGPLVFGLLVWRVTSQTLRPLRGLSASLEKMAAGDLATPLPAPLHSDETGSMLHSFERVRLTMRAALRNLTARAAAQERLANELAVARAIQESMLTTEFPAMDGADVCARIDMAREVCGDLYDCFLADSGVESAAPRRLCCVVGDVSGKGVPAAMLTSGAMSLARAALLAGLSPATALGRVNEALVRTATAGMFVTMLAGVLDTRTGLFTWASAGHPPPMRAKPARPGREANATPGDWPGELALGIKKGLAYTDFSFRLEQDEALLLYTDGASEALAPAGRGARGRSGVRAFYGEDRLALSLVRNLEKDGARGLLEGVRADIFTHMANAEPHDDITLMVIRRACPSGGSEPNA